MRMTKLVPAAAALALLASAASAQQQEGQQEGGQQQLAEIDKPASQLDQVLAHQVDLQGGPQEVRVVTATIDPKTAAGWHTHPMPVYVFVQEGSLTMEVEGKEPRQLTAGEATAEPLDARMRVINEGDQPAKLVVFQISPAEEAFLEQEPGQGQGQEAAPAD